jgi:hypothetical protein
MASLFFTCPTTHQQAPTGIETDVQSLQAAWKATLKIKCPHCGEMHEISVRETYINGALEDATDWSWAFITAPQRDPPPPMGGSSLPAPDAHDHHSIESDVLDQDMTPSDLVWALENLRFTRDRNALSTLRIDRQVRDYLIAALRSTHGPACSR